MREKTIYVIQWQSFDWADSLSVELCSDNEFTTKYPDLVDIAQQRNPTLICDTHWRGVKRFFTFEDDGKTVESIANTVLVCTPIIESAMAKDYRLSRSKN